MKKFVLFAVSSMTTLTMALAATPAPTPAKPPVAATDPGARQVLLACQTRIKNGAADFTQAVNNGVQRGLIDPKELAALKTMQAEIATMEQKANADTKLDMKECDAIYTKILDGQLALKHALDSKPVAAPAAPVVPAPKACLAALTREAGIFKTRLDEGVKSGLVDPKELKSLKDRHSEIVFMEQKANADAKMDKTECDAIYAKIVAENKALNDALASKVAAPVVGKPGLPPVKKSP